MQEASARARNDRPWGLLLCRLQRQEPTSDEVGMRENLTRTW